MGYAEGGESNMNPFIDPEFYEQEEYRLRRDHVRGEVEDLVEFQVKWE